MSARANALSRSVFIWRINESFSTSAAMTDSTFSGVEVEAHSATVWTFREGKVTRIKFHRTSDEALKAVGLAG